MKPEGSQLLRWRHHLAYFNVASMTWLTCFTNDHIYAPFVVITIPSFPHSWFVTTVTRRMPLVEQELKTFPSSRVHHWFSVLVRVALCLVFCVVLCWLLFVFCPFGHCIVILPFTTSGFLFGILNKNCFTFMTWILYFTFSHLIFNMIPPIRSNLINYHLKEGFFF